jgi:hypothetical protein
MEGEGGAMLYEHSLSLSLVWLGRSLDRVDCLLHSTAVTTTI